MVAAVELLWWDTAVAVEVASAGSRVVVPFVSVVAVAELLSVVVAAVTMKHQMTDPRR